MQIKKLSEILKISFLLIFIFSKVIFAKTFYVNSINGNDNNNGLSPSSAWKTINKVNHFPFSKGDVIAFKRGQIFTGYTLRPNRSHLTFTAYGSGNLPVIDGQNTLTYCIIWVNKSNITFRSIKCFNSTLECLDANNANYLTIDSCVFDANFHQAQTVYIGLSYYVHISNSVFQNAAGYTYPHGLYLGGGGYQIVEHNMFLNNQMAGIHINVNVNPNGRVPHPIIRYNWFEGNTEDFQDQATDSLEFYYNVIVDNPTIPYADGIIFSYEAAYSSFAPINAKVYNNTIIMNDSLTSHSAIFIYGNSYINNLSFKNNIIFYLNSHQTSGYFVYQQPGSGSIYFDNNLFYRTGGSQNNFASIKGTAYNSFSAWQAAGYDTHGLWVNPGLLDKKNLNFKFFLSIMSRYKMLNK